MATGQWDALQMFARARAVLHADGRLEVESAATDIGTGTYTVMAQIAATAMGLPMERVTFRLGDSTLPVAPIEGASSHVTTIGSAVDGACEKLQNRLWKLARGAKDSPLAKTQFDEVEFVEGTIRRRGDPASAVSFTGLLAEAGEERIEEKFLLLPNMARQKKYIRTVNSAVFCEVRVDEELGTVRVTRVVSAVAAGRIMNALTARSQVIGGIVWGISQALHEETHADHRLGRFMNHNYAEYHVAANADIHDIDVIFVDEDDRIVSRLGAKGVGEIGIVGVAAAVSNAIYHATGRRIRSTPMTPDKVMAPGEGWESGDSALGINGERGEVPTQREFVEDRTGVPA
jgi:xanthine dehydrogenase YagR molybdenum-binding subunit